LCRSLVSEDMARCIVHYIAGCDADSSFYGKGKSLAYDKVTRSVATQQTPLKCGNSLDVDEDIIDELLKFTRNLIYGDKKISCIAGNEKEVFSSNSSRYSLPAPTLYSCKLLDLFSPPPIVKETSFTNWSWNGASGWLLSPC